MKFGRVCISGLLLPMLFLGAGFGICPCRLMSSLYAEVSPETVVVRSCCRSIETSRQKVAEKQVAQHNACCCGCKVFLGSVQDSKIFEGRTDSSKGACAVLFSFAVPKMVDDLYAHSVGPAPPSKISTRPIYLLKSAFLL